MIELRPTSWVNKFLKSATFGQKYTERTKRILSLIIIPIWLFALILCGLIAINGIQGIINYSDAKKLLKDVPKLRENREEYFGNSKFGEIRQFSGVDKKEYARLGVEDVQFWDDEAPSRAIRVQQNKIQSLWNIFLVIGVFIILPWLLLRLIYWIIRADNKNKI